MDLTLDPDSILQMHQKANLPSLRLLFLCGSLEPGRDGVGDYTRRLAASLCRKGHKVSIVSCNDRFVAHTIQESQSCEGSTIDVLRIAATEKNIQRSQQIKNWIIAFDPDWISLQFVLFSFHKKGLPIHLKKVLMKAGNGRKWHVMFHEIWVGLEKKASQKEILWGKLQKWIIYSLLQTLKPAFVHTHTKIYQGQLKTLGINSSYLPLFSNIPKVKGVDERSKNGYSLVLFGSIHPNAPMIEFANELKAYTEKKGVRTQVTLVGRSGGERQKWKAALITAGIRVNDKGEQSETEISLLLSAATVGITTTPFALAEKSGTVAAMMDHGLPVICVSKIWKQRHRVANVDLPEGISEYRPGNLESCLTKKEPPVSKNVDDIALQLLHDLQSPQLPTANKAPVMLQNPQ